MNLFRTTLTMKCKTINPRAMRFTYQYFLGNESYHIPVNPNPGMQRNLIKQTKHAKISNITSILFQCLISDSFFFLIGAEDFLGKNIPVCSLYSR